MSGGGCGMSGGGCGMSGGGCGMSGWRVWDEWVEGVG